MRTEINILTGTAFMRTVRALKSSLTFSLFYYINDKHMKTQHNATDVAQDAKETVLSMVDAINDLDFAKARQYAHTDMQFIGVMGSRDGADAYFKDMEKMKLKYAVKKAFVDGDDVCLLSDLQIDGKTILCCSWYQVKGDKVKTLKVIFDPRPLMENAGKQ